MEATRPMPDDPLDDAQATEGESLQNYDDMKCYALMAGLKQDCLVISLCKKSTTSYTALPARATKFMQVGNLLHARTKRKV